MAIESSTIAEHLRYRRPRTQIISNSDPNPSLQSTRAKSTISSLLCTFTPNDNTKKKNFTSATFRGLGCAASSQVSVPAMIRTSADWEAKKVKKKQKKKQRKNRAIHQDLGMGNTNNTNPSSSSSSVVVPDVWCGPGIGFTTDAASVDCVVSRRPLSGKGKIDADKINHRERSSCPARRTVRPEHNLLLDSDHAFGMEHPGLDVFGARYHRHARHRSPEGLAELVMFQNSMLIGGRSVGFDRYRDLRLDVDNMSYEELLELGERIGHVNTGLREDEILCCLRKTKPLVSDDLSYHLPMEMERKCSICQEEYEADDEMGKLDCGHFYHIQCIKLWLAQKNICPICKTAAVAQ